MEKTTKERILEEAVRLFSRRGYMGTSMSDIAGQLGITKAALYKRYTGKQEILDCIISGLTRWSWRACGSTRCRRDAVNSLRRDTGSFRWSASGSLPRREMDWIEPFNAQLTEAAIRDCSRS